MCLRHLHLTRFEWNESKLQQHVSSMCCFLQSVRRETSIPHKHRDLLPACRAQISRIRFLVYNICAWRRGVIDIDDWRGRKLHDWTNKVWSYADQTLQLADQESNDHEQAEIKIKTRVKHIHLYLDLDLETNHKKTKGWVSQRKERKNLVDHKSSHFQKQTDSNTQK